MNVLSNPARILITFVFLVTAVVLSNDIYAQPVEESPVYQVRDVRELGLVGSVLWTTQWYFVPSALTGVVPLYAYDFPTACSNVRQENQNIFGQAAIVGSWDALNANGHQNVAPSSAGLGVLFYEDVSMALARFSERFGVNCNSNSPNSDQDVFVATTFPIPQVDPARRFLVTAE